MRLRYIANNLKLTPGDPTAMDPADREESYQQSARFRCAYRPITAPQQVRAGRDSAERGIRVFYRGRDVSLSNGDRLLIDGRKWSVITPAYVDSTNSVMSYVDCVEIVQ